MTLGITITVTITDLIANAVTAVSDVTYLFYI